MDDPPKKRQKIRNCNPIRYFFDALAENAYTEDLIPIKTINVGNVFSKITEKELKVYFSKFGSIASVAVKRAGSKRAPGSYAFVTFEKSESAAKALRLAKHEILNRRVVVNAAKSTWNEVSTDEMKFSLLDLNDDCLYHIGSYLKLRDLLNLSKTCKRLECGLKPAFASYKELVTDSLDGLELKEIEEILYTIGPHVQHIVYGEDFDIVYGRRFEELVKKYCVATNIVSLDSCRSWSLPKRLIETFKNLKTLKCNVTEDMIAVLSNCSNLQNLDLCDTGITGKHLDKLSNLQNLNLDGCDTLQPTFFKNLCMKTKLVSLSIVGCPLLDYSSIETLASTQTKLENLSIRNDYRTSNISPLATLKNLKRLLIDCASAASDDFFQELAKHRGAELEVLEIWEYPFNQKVEQAICSLKKLKVLAVDVCWNITSMFFTKLATTPIECLAVQPLESILEEGLLNLIRKSETIKVIALDTKRRVKQRLVRSAYEIIRSKERKCPLILFKTAPCIIDGILHEDPEFKPRREFLKIIKKLGYLDPLPEWFNFDAYLCG